MRVFGRFLYALVAVGFFLLAFTYSRDLMLSNYLEDVFGASLVDEDSELPKYYYFYTSVPDYHNSEPIIQIESNGYDIYGYEVLTAQFNNDNELILTETVYIVVYSATEELARVSHIEIEDSSTETITDISLQRFKTLYILNGINDEGRVYIPKETFFTDSFDKLYLIDNDDNILVDIDFDINEEDFIIEDFISTFYQDNNRLPTIDDLADLTGNNIFPNKIHVADDYQHIFYIAMGIYFTVLIVATYLIFFRKKKYR